jgi:hypothetical protein
VIKLSAQKTRIVNAILAVCKENEITVQTGENSIEFSQSNTPLIVITADLCEYALAPLDTAFTAGFIKDQTVISALPMELIAATLEKTLSDKIEYVSNLLYTKIDVTSYEPLSASSKFSEYIDFSFHSENKQINIPLRLYFKNESSVNNFLDRLAALNKQEYIPDSLLSVHFEKIIGSQSFSYEELNSLETGDAVFLEKNFYIEKKILLKSDRITYILDTGENNEAIISHESFEGSEIMNSNEEVNLDKLTLNVEFSLGSKDMTVEELKQLAPGSSVNLEDPDLSNIQLKVNGQIIGYGHLIQVNDQYAVQINRINNK